MRFVNDLGEIFQDTKEMLKGFYDLIIDPSEAPPTVRNFKTAHWPLKNTANEPVGSFAPELYELAKIRGLIAQEQEDAFNAQNPLATSAQKQGQAWYTKLYKADGTAKTAFELSILPVIYDDYDNNAVDKVRAMVKPELEHRIKSGKPLPPVIYKYLVKADYLKNLSQINLVAVAPRDLTIDVSNPGASTTYRDRAFHYIAQKTSMLLMLVAVLGLSTANPTMFALAALGAVIADWCGKDFGTFGTAEVLLRDLSSLFLKDFRWGDAISFKKTLKTVVQALAIGYTGYLIFPAVYAGVMGLSLFSSVTTGIAASALSIAKVATAGYVAAISTLMAVAGAKDANHFFWGLGIWYKHVDCAKENELPVLTRLAAQKAMNHVHEEEFIADCKFAGKELDQAQLERVHAAFAQIDNVADAIFNAPLASVTSLKDAREAKAKEKAKEVAQEAKATSDKKAMQRKGAKK